MQTKTNSESQLPENAIVDTAISVAAEVQTEKGWKTTNRTNLLLNKQTGIYYGRVKVNGKQKWRSLKTDVYHVADARLADFELQMKTLRTAGGSSASHGILTKVQTHMSHFIELHRAAIKANDELAPATKSRKDIAVKALLKTWPKLLNIQANRVTEAACLEWAKRARRDGTGFVAPMAKTIRSGMSTAAFNKCVDELRAIMDLAIAQGAAYANPAKAVAKLTVEQKVLNLPSTAQFQAIVVEIDTAGARQSADCAVMARLLAFSGARLAEATALRWSHVNFEKSQLTIPGTKSKTSLRTIPMNESLANLLREIQATRDIDLAEMPILAIHECKGALRSACAKVGVQRLTHHDLRHLFATRCIESGVDIPTVSRWLGHADGGALAMRTYGHLRDEHSQQQATKVKF